jgi:prepilin-type N-terminal cleavage/methylation domain-containing protein
MKRQAGFTMVELMVTMVVFVITIAAASQIFTRLLTQFKQQSKIAETNIEGIVGLEILRQDIAHAGLGLPWNVTGIADTNGDGVINFSDNVPGYTETGDPIYAAYNDAPNNPPSAFRSGDGATAGGSDYLVIKSASAATTSTAGKNTRLTSSAPFVRTWTLYTDDLSNTDRVIVLSPGATDANSRSLVVNGGSYHTQYSMVAAYAPADNTDVRLVYGISAANAANSLRAPFNRADYYISSANLPSRCATGTGVLNKATLNQDTAAASEFTEMPILDCVADMQVIYSLDNDENGYFENGIGGDAYTNSLVGLTPLQIRTRVKEVQVYILAHEGQRDTKFTFNNFTAGACATCVRVGRSAVLGRDFDLSVITDYLNYRWKIYTMSVRTDNLR